MASWCTVESDPGVFSEMIEKLGCPSVQVEEVYGLEAESFAEFGQVHGLIFLFKWKPGLPRRSALTPDACEHVYFARQVIQNACATQAILAVLMNAPSVDLGPMLSEFKAFTMDLPSDLKGESFNNSDQIRTVHNSFARAEPFVLESKAATGADDDEVYHFISYMQVGDRCYELDGLQDGPIDLGQVKPGETWLDCVRPEIQRRIEQYSATEIRFSLMAVVKNRALQAKERLFTLQYLLAILDARLGELGVTVESVDTSDWEAAEMDLDMDLGASYQDMGEAALLAERADLLAQAQEAQRTIASETAKFQRWRIENERRRHNYVPLAMEVLKLLAEKNQLMPTLEAGRKKAKELHDRLSALKKEKKAAAGSAGADAGADDEGDEDDGDDEDVVAA